MGRGALAVASMAALLGVAVAFAVLFGTEPVSLVRAVTVPDSIDHAIVMEARLPRVLLGAVAGGGLALVGVAFQSILRNPLAEPYVLGVSAPRRGRRRARTPHVPGVLLRRGRHRERDRAHRPRGARRAARPPACLRTRRARPPPRVALRGRGDARLVRPVQPPALSMAPHGAPGGRGDGARWAARCSWRFWRRGARAGSTGPRRACAR